MIVEKIHEKFSFKQSKWLEKYTSFNKQKETELKMLLKKISLNYLLMLLLVKRWKMFVIDKKSNLLKNMILKKIIIQQSKLLFTSIHKSYENCGSYTFKQNDEPIYVGFAILELSKLHMHETYYDKLQPYFGQENLQLHCIDTDGMILNMKTDNIINDLKKLEDLFDFSNLDENHELFSNDNKRLFGIFKIETPKIICINELVCLRSKMYVFECGDESKNKKK